MINIYWYSPNADSSGATPLFCASGQDCHVFEAAPACTGGKVFKNCHHQVNIILLHLYNQFKSSLSLFIRSSQLPSTSLGRRAPGTTLIYSFPTLASCLCCGHGLWCGCACSSQRSSVSQWALGKQKRLLRKAFCKVLTKGMCMICYSPANAYASDVMHLSSQFALYCM